MGKGPGIAGSKAGEGIHIGFRGMKSDRQRLLLSRVLKDFILPFLHPR
jgi:hypothetical protein